jgi:glyoxylase I family protein
MEATDAAGTTAGVRVQGYSHVAVAVTDLEAARRFYREHFGFEELPRPDFPGAPGAWLAVGDLQLHLVAGPEMPVLGRSFPHFALHVTTEDFDATVDGLRAAGVPFVGEPSERVDFGRAVRAAFVADPSGNIIELTDVGPLSGPG